MDMDRQAQAVSEPIAYVVTLLDGLRKDIEEQQRNIYILSGVFGGVDLALIIAVLVLLYLTLQVKKQLREVEIQKKLEEEMNAQKLTAYTGEEMHRKLMAVTNPAIPLSQIQKGGGGPESEYAFNVPLPDIRSPQVSPLPPMQNGMPGGASANRFSRFN